MADREEYLFSNFLEIFPLEETCCCIGSLPNLLAFGKCTANKFLKNQTFLFSTFEIHKLYFAFVKILEYFTMDSTDLISSKQIILIKSLLSETYFWEAKVFNVNNKSVKHVFLSIEYDTKLTFRYPIKLQNLDCIFNLLIHLIPTTVCFNSKDFKLFERCMQNSLESLLKINNNEEKQIIEKIINDLEIKTPLEVHHAKYFITYFHEILILNKKLTSLIRPENPRLAILNMM
jgi:hypothetical protein